MFRKVLAGCMLEYPGGTLIVSSAVVKMVRALGMAHLFLEHLQTAHLAAALGNALGYNCSLIISTLHM